MVAAFSIFYFSLGRVRLSTSLLGLWLALKNEDPDHDERHAREVLRREGLGVVAHDHRERKGKVGERGVEGRHLRQNESETTAIAPKSKKVGGGGAAQLRIG